MKTIPALLFLLLFTQYVKGQNQDSSQYKITGRKEKIVTGWVVSCKPLSNGYFEVIIKETATKDLVTFISPFEIKAPEKPTVNSTEAHYYHAKDARTRQKVYLIHNTYTINLSGPKSWRSWKEIDKQ